MIAAFAANLAEGYLAPRRSAERLLATEPGWIRAVELAALSFAIQVVLVSGTQLALEDAMHIGGGAVDRLAVDFGSLGERAVQAGGVLGVEAALAYWIGRFAGGVGGFWAVASVVGWHGVVTAFLMPLFTIAAVELATEASAGAFGLLLFLSLLTVWLFAAYVAAAHRFASVLFVFMSIAGLAMAFGMVAMLFSPALVQLG